jgi:hypothetical protein
LEIRLVSKLIAHFGADQSYHLVVSTSEAGVELIALVEIGDSGNTGPVALDHATAKRVIAALQAAIRDRFDTDEAKEPKL